MSNHLTMSRLKADTKQTEKMRKPLHSLTINGPRVLGTMVRSRKEGRQTASQTVSSESLQGPSSPLQELSAIILSFMIGVIAATFRKISPIPEL